MTMQMFFLFFGMAEIFTNGYYLLSKNLAKLGRRHHIEMPRHISDQEVVDKVKRMLVIGAVSLVFAGLSLVFEPKMVIVAPALLLGVVVYEAIKYKYWRIYAEVALAVLFLVATIFALW